MEGVGAQSGEVQRRKNLGNSITKCSGGRVSGVIGYRRIIGRKSLNFSENFFFGEIEQVVI